MLARDLRGDKGVPQCPQKLLLAGFSCPQYRQDASDILLLGSGFAFTCSWMGLVDRAMASRRRRGRLKNSLGVRNSSVNLWIEPLYTLTGRLLFSGSYGDND
jgi:hypothetical protein